MTVILLGQIRAHHDSLVANRQPSNLSCSTCSVVGTSRCVAGSLTTACCSYETYAYLPVTSYLTVEIGTQVIPAVIEVIDIAVLLQETSSHKVMVVGRTTLQRNVVLHVGTRTKYLVDIIDVIPSVCRVTVGHCLNIIERKDGLILRTVGNNTVGKLVHHVGHIIIMCKLGAVHELWEIGIYRHTILAVVAHFRLSVVAFPGGNDDYTTARVQSVHGSCRTILQH